MPSGVYKRKKTPVENRIKDKIVIDPETGCHIWTGCKNCENGYGKIRFNGKMVYAHRLTYELQTGIKIPEGMDICHHCDNRACVNFEHLFLGTRKENMEDCFRKGRQSKHARPKGEKNGQSKLTEEEVIQIRSDPRSLRRIAIEYGISTSLVFQIKRREIWRHV